MRIAILQLGLLVWKCWKTESRKKIRIACEMIFPLFMFLIVVAVRNSLKLRQSQQECHFGAKPLISAGVVPFIQGLICHSNNSCQASKTLSEMGYYPFNKTLISSPFDPPSLPTTTLEPTLPLADPDAANLINMVTSFWDTLCDESFPLSSGASNLDGTTTTTMAPPASFGSNNELGKINPLRCLIRFPSVTTTQRTPFQNGTVTRPSTLFNAAELLPLNLNISRAELEAQLQCRRFICVLQSIAPLWNTLSRLMMGRIVFYPNSTIVNNLMARVEATMDWASVLQEAAMLANSFAFFIAGVGGSGGGGRNRNRARQSAETTQLTNVLNCLYRYVEDNRFEGVDKVDRMISRAMRYASINRLTAAVHFYDADQLMGDKLPTVVRYGLRFDPSTLDKTNEVKDRPFNTRVRRNALLEMPYFLSGFIYLQDAIDKAIIKMQQEQQEKLVPGSTSPDFTEVGTIMQQFPFPCYLEDVFLLVLANQLTLYIVLGWIFLAAIIVKSIVLEKERKLREVARIMGISPGLHFLSWFIFWSFIMIGTLLLFLIILKVGGVFVYSSAGVIFVFMLTYSFATISFCFFVSSFFNRANVAAVVSGLVYFLTYIAYVGITNANGDSLDLQKMIISSVVPNIALGYGWQVVASYELTTEGISFSTFTTPVSDEPADQFTMIHAILTLLFDTWLYYFLAWYVDYVFPGEFGVPLPWYFVLQPSFWFNSCGNYHLNCWNQTDESCITTIEHAKDFETEPSHLNIGCALRSVVKTYNFGLLQQIRNLFSQCKSGKAGKKSKGRSAVDHLSLNIYENQITALLGHNGAGKTTTMSIITGLIPATSGSVSVYGHDVARELAKVRRLMGFCPQFNVLYDDLTVEEHMSFFARIRGLESSRVSADIEQMLNDTDLTLKRRELAKHLSGGMRRRLSIAVAFIGQSKCVILDEPTAGVDPYARRSIWDLLAKFRTVGRTIILSTHHMDEAEILADRIAIISHGRLQTCGSPLFLKQTHGEGYRMTVVRSCDNKNVNSAVLSDDDLRHEKIITTFLTSQLKPASCKMVAHSGAEIQYQLGYDGVPAFPRVFNSLDESLSQLKISSYGLSDTTLEEVFIKITNEWLDPDSSNESPDGAAPSSNLVKYEPLEGVKLIALQFYALLVKRFHRMKRSWKGFIVELLLPVLFVLLGVAIIKLAEFRPDNPPPLELHPWVLAPGPQSARDQRLYTFFNAVNLNSTAIRPEVLKALRKVSARSDYAGTRCMDSYDLEKHPCSASSVNDSNWSTNERYRQRECTCSVDGVQLCSASSSDSALPKFKQLRTGDDVLELSGFDVSDYLLAQYKALRHNLYGGWSFLIPSPAFGARLSEFLAFSGRPGQPKLFSRDSLLVWFNNKGWPSSVAYNNYVNNMLLRLALTNDADYPNSSYGIVTFNHPLNYTRGQLAERLQLAAIVDVMFVMMLILALSFVPSSFVMFLIEDRVSHSKHVQMVSGLRPANYWLANYTWDCLNYLIPVAACLIIFVAFDVEAYVDDMSIGSLVLLFICYGFAVAPMLYPTSLFFTTPSTAFVILSCTSLFIGSGTTIATWFLDLLYARGEKDLEKVNDILKIFFFLFPQYCFGRGLLNLAISYRTAQGRAFFTGGDLEGHEPLQWDVCGKFLVALFLHNIGWLMVNIILAYYLPIVQNKVVESKAKAQRKMAILWRKLRCWSGQRVNEMSAVGSLTSVIDKADADVAAEEKLILKQLMNSKAYSLVVRNLTKTFETSRGRLTAVDKLTFGVPNGQCFGLLGVNGAGKSTTFNMLTGLLSPSSGTAFIQQLDILRSRNQANRLIGYCPQYDCITPLLSGRENLEFFARIRGVPERHVKAVAQYNIQRLDLIRHAEKTAGAYSGGNKRKLSVAIALTGEPVLILLDEPTAGIDPKARRHLWKAVRGLLRNGQSVILTTHSMDECETLCNRIAIMVNGRFRCLGSPQHLKARFGEGYLLTLRFNPAANQLQLHKTALNRLKTFFEDVFLKESHDNVGVYALGASGLASFKIGELFQILNDASLKTDLGIRDYSLMQSSLDAVFVTFAKLQRSEGVEGDGNGAGAVDVQS